MSETASIIWSNEMISFLINQWQDMVVWKILDGKTKRNAAAHQKMAEAIMEQFKPQATMQQLQKSLKNKMKLSPR